MKRLEKTIFTWDINFVFETLNHHTKNKEGIWCNDHSAAIVLNVVILSDITALQTKLFKSSLFKVFTGSILLIINNNIINYPLSHLVSLLKSLSNVEVIFFRSFSSVIFSCCICCMQQPSDSVTADFKKYQNVFELKKLDFGHPSLFLVHSSLKQRSE